MSITVDLDPAAEARLRDKAEREGLDLGAAASMLLAEALEAEERRRVKDALERGLRDADMGRVTPLAEWDARVRARHGILADTVPLGRSDLASVPHR
jgi:predicted transcriptional regulator